jgi:hypothetical protein
LPFSGNVETIPLDEVFQFVATNSLDGMLTVAGGGARLSIYFENGQLFFPFSAKRGTYSLGKILRQTGVLSREALEKHLESARQSRLAELRELESQASAVQIEEARRKQYEEEIHDVFLWHRAYFEFTPGALPEDIQRERSQGKGVVLDPTAFLMEVARRTDERRRIRRSIPAARAILLAKAEAEASIVKDLNARQIDVSANPFDGTCSLEQLLEQWGIPHHQSLAAVTPLVEAGKLVPLPADRARASLDEAIAAGNSQKAGRFVSHLMEVEAAPARPLDLGPEKALLRSKAFTASTDELAFTARVSGPRAFSIVRELMAAGVSFTISAREDGREKRLALSDQQLSLQASADDVTPSVGRYLRKANTISEADFKAATVAAEQQHASLSEVLIAAQKISEDDWLAAALEKTIDEIGELLLWREVDLDVRNRCRAFTGRGDVGSLALALPMTLGRRARLTEGLERWSKVGDVIPGEDALYLLGGRAQATDPAAKFFARFDGKRTVGELRRIAKAEPLEFLRFVEAGLRRGYAHAPSREELGARLADAVRRQDDVRAYKIARAGVVFGYGPQFQEQLTVLRGRDASPSPDSRPSITGDMVGLGLAAVLQGLRGRKRTGTLQLTDGKRETKLYFHRGSLFLLQVENAQDQEFVNFFLDGEESQLEFVDMNLGAKGNVNEADLDAADARRLKDEVLDVLFWDKAQFSFMKNELPDEFFEPGENATKVALDTDSFLMEAIGRIQEWDGVRQAIPSGLCRLSFATPESKFDAIRERGMPEVLTLLDGRKTFEDVVRISGQPRLEVGRVLRELVEAGSLTVLEPAAASA